MSNPYRTPGNPPPDEPEEPEITTDIGAVIRYAGSRNNISWVPDPDPEQESANLITALSELPLPLRQAFYRRLTTEFADGFTGSTKRRGKPRVHRWPPAR